MGNGSDKLRKIDLGEDFGPVEILVNGVAFFLWPDDKNVKVLAHYEDNFTVDVMTGGPVRVSNPDGSMQRVLERRPSDGRYEFNSLQTVQGGPKTGGPS
jgi:hypothetical protein